MALLLALLAGQRSHSCKGSDLFCFRGAGRNSLSGNLLQWLSYHLKAFFLFRYAESNLKADNGGSTRTRCWSITVRLHQMRAVRCRGMRSLAVTICLMLLWVCSEYKQQESGIFFQFDFCFCCVASP
uniref:(northern house mosquito) hypothetical protein n=1 Tax=Culex pipiens TaxID=7175 RepID=A0A8D8EU56_CULPI